MLKQTISLQILERLSSRNFTWSILEYFDQYNLKIHGQHHFNSKALFDLLKPKHCSCMHLPPIECKSLYNKSIMHEL